MERMSETHETRKALFQKGVREGRLTLAEIEKAIPKGSLSPTERWLLFYSLRAAEIAIDETPTVSVEPSPPAEMGL